jgi:hypothetical protein
MKYVINMYFTYVLLTVFTRTNTGIVGSNHTRCMDICVRLFCVCVVLCVGSGLATGWSPVQGVLLTVYRLRNWKSGQGSKCCRAIETGRERKNILLGFAKRNKLIFSVITRRNPLTVHRRLGEAYRRGLLFNLEDSGGMLLRKVGWLWKDYMALHPEMTDQSINQIKDNLLLRLETVTFGQTEERKPVRRILTVGFEFSSFKTCVRNGGYVPEWAFFCGWLCKYVVLPLCGSVQMCSR